MIPILGMHRSGTSALAGALHKLGADLGPESSWLAPAADNPLGFFEYQPVVATDRAILAAFGGTWSSPPPLPPGWLHDERLDALRDRIEQLAAEMPSGLVVKDPRLSLTLPAWDAVIEPTHALLCVRHPVAVAQSLHKRNGFPIDAGLLLWFRYNAAALLNRPSATIIEYEQLLQSPELELARSAAAIGLRVIDSAVDLSATSIRDGLAHHEPAPIPDTPIGVICRALYDALRSGTPLIERPDVSLWARLVTEFPWAGPSDRELLMAKADQHVLEHRIAELTEQHRRLTDRATRLERELRDAHRHLDQLSFRESSAQLTDHEGFTHS